MLKNESRVECIIQVVCEKYGLTFSDLENNSRKSLLCNPRAIAMTLCYAFTKNSKVKIASVFNRDHATLIHNSKKFLAYYQTEKTFKSNVDFIIMEINQRLNTNFVFEHIEDALNGFKSYDDTKTDSFQLFVSKARELMDVQNPELILMIVNEMKEIYKGV